MKKSVILTKAEYDQLLKIARLAFQLNQQYIEKENECGNFEHPMDRDGCDPLQETLYKTLLYLDDDIKRDLIDELPADYKILESSALFED